MVLAKGLRASPPFLLHSGHVEMVALLVESGSKPNPQDKVGRSVVFWAAQQGKHRVVTYLTNSLPPEGACVCVCGVGRLTSRVPTEIHMPDTQDNTPLHAAALAGCILRWGHC